MSDIPTWAKERASQLASQEGSDLKWGKMEHYQVGQAFARYIAAHEEPPVDPLLVEAREIVADWWERNPARFPGSKPEDYREGKRDADAEIEQALAALKRGMELAE